MRKRGRYTREFKLEAVRSQIDVCRAERERYLQAGPGPSPAREQLKSAFDDLQDTIGSLHGMLRHPLGALKSKDKFRPVLRPGAREIAFSRELDQLTREFGKAEQRIVDYFLDSKNTVHQKDLAGDNMLIHLHRARKLAQLVKKTL